MPLAVVALAAESGSVQKLTKSFGKGHTVQLEVQNHGKPASAGSILQATSDLISANPDAAVTVLDHSALKVGCESPCRYTACCGEEVQKETLNMCC